MWKKSLLSVSGLLAAFLAPVLFFKIPVAWSYLRQPAAESQPTYTADPATIVMTNHSSGPSYLPATTAQNSAVAVTPARDLGEILRFDVTPNWIAQRWPRVSTGMADLQLQGYRVPLVTGTSEVDLAGALTYYFNANQQVQRITFTGTTGNYFPLLNFLTTKHRFTHRVTADPSILIYESVTSDGKSAGLARFRTAPMLRANDFRQRFEIELVIERPET